jgi:hypothetical protein
MSIPREVDRGDVWVRCHGPFEKGFVYKGHRHWIDHDSYVHEGTTLVVRYRDAMKGPVLREIQYQGPCRFFVAAGLYHEIEVLSEEGNWDCEFKKIPVDSPVYPRFNQELLDKTDFET